MCQLNKEVTQMSNSITWQNNLKIISKVSLERRISFTETQSINTIESMMATGTQPKKNDHDKTIWIDEPINYKSINE